ncbi:MAG TPA: phasin family protein [Burkholderiales bacterium]|nr:phasin family protein [Burkholderiales bacterium]
MNLERICNREIVTTTTEKSVMGAKTISDLLHIQLNWMTANLERSVAYWNQMFQAAAEANAKLAEYLREYEEPGIGAQKKRGAR